ncbi:hypothetical protein [Paenarthrobacter sp. JL.01a]|uniref:hypothetical protein n=1 Tax=Paenarthrobacter sp. JL.01a TaxID=2979324 RepID=UPI0021C803D6|nr:hypothetical protein [Paenarthrobacter sp. JL.01a]UXM92534.1 hypothetical protein N5P29_04190 [Paenarthrobacter sp. JL.01a]
MTAAGIPALLEPIQARLDAATPGPWEASDVVDMDVDGTYELAHVLAPDPGEPETSTLGVALGILRPDAEFIANSPTDTARLLAAVKAVEELHKPFTHHFLTPPAGSVEICLACHEQWPCETVSAVEAALRGEA